MYIILIKRLIIKNSDIDDIPCIDGIGNNAEKVAKASEDVRKVKRKVNFKYNKICTQLKKQQVI